MPEELKLNPLTVQRGMGVTVHYWSDRNAYTVVDFTPSRKTIKIQRDKATPNGPIHDREQYDYTYERDESAPLKVARWSAKRNRYVMGGTVLSMGRHEYYDPTF